MFGVNQNDFINDGCMINVPEHEFARDLFILSTVTCPIMEGCAHLCNKVIVRFVPPLIFPKSFDLYFTPILLVVRSH